MGQEASNRAQQCTATTATTTADRSQQLVMAAEVLRQRVVQHADEAKLFVKVTRDDIAKLVATLNDITENSEQGIGPSFRLDCADCDSLLWKVKARVICIKAHSGGHGGDSASSSFPDRCVRRLSIRQILHLYRDAQHLFDLPDVIERTDSSFVYVDNGSDVEPPSVNVNDSGSRVHAADALPHAMTSESPGDFADAVVDECCICLDSEVDVTLPCAHSYCEKCISCWQRIDSSCPMCKQCTESADDVWIMPSPGPSSVGRDMCPAAVLSVLVDRLVTCRCRLLMPTSSSMSVQGMSAVARSPNDCGRGT